MQYSMTEQDGTYTCTIPLQLKDGRVLLVQGRASVSEVAGDFGMGYSEFEEVGGIFGSIGKFFKKVAKSKALKKAVKITKGIIKNPVTNVALGVVTGGASVPAMTSAAAAIKIAESATKGSKKKRKKAKRMIKASMRQAKKRDVSRIAKRKALKSGKYPKSSLRKVQLKEKEYKKQIARLKTALKGKKLKKLSSAQRRNITKLLTPYVTSLRFA